ncbi:MAG TPA: cation-translocating P-type ATPase [Nitrospira sp.]|nr:cation-translocating P-type ATPase [Nitrospira sp.]
MEQRQTWSLTSAWHALAIAATVHELNSNTETGLSSQEVEERRARAGWNELPDAAPPSWLALLASQFTSLIIWVLIAAALVSGLLDDWVDAAAILAIVLLNGLLGFIQEFRAGRSLAALRKLSVATGRVIRDGAQHLIPARELVPGDLILLEAGDRIPADARLFYTVNLQTQESSLTGESTPVPKDERWVGEREAPLADRRNMVFMGTTVASGKGRALVVATGRQTELGRISSMIQTAEAVERAETPLQRRLERFGYTLLFLALGVVAVVFALGFLRGEPLVGLFLTSVSLAVAAVPEGLPAVVTITLALGVTRMAARHALIRKLPAVETLGSVTVICTDKTGTLTKNEMTVTRLYADDRLFEVTGEGYEPTGHIREMPGESGATSSHLAELPPSLRQLLTAGVLCNGATLEQEGGTWTVIGDPTEGALLVAAAKAGLQRERLERAAPFEREIPFDTERKMMSLVRRTETGSMVFSKGALDSVLTRCSRRLTRDGATEPLTETARQAIVETSASLARAALRVLAAAFRPLDPGEEKAEPDVIERELVFLGLFAMKDPLRPEAVEAVRACREAGIRIVMVTGDHKETAAAIARELGVMRPEDRPLSAEELDALPDERLAHIVDRVPVYARVSAEHKLRIIRAWQSRGAVVAMTGDGVNDAPAIKASDIGVAMGRAGTDVTKEAADMVVTDDNFASIAAAVEEGRAVFDNIRKTVRFLLSCNMSEVLVMLLAALVGLPLPLLPIQILWMNLVTDGFPALALAADPKAPDLMRRPPRPPKAGLLDRRGLTAIAAEGLMLALIALGAFAWSLFVWRQPVEAARTVTFTVMVGAQFVHAFNCRSDRWSLFQMGPLTNRWLIGAACLSLGAQILMLTMPDAERIFKTTSVPLEDWGLMIAVPFLPFVIVEAAKLLMRRRAPGADGL